MMREDGTHEWVTFWSRHKIAAEDDPYHHKATEGAASPPDNSAFFYDLAIIVAGLAGVIILLRLIFTGLAP